MSSVFIVYAQEVDAYGEIFVKHYGVFSDMNGAETAIKFIVDKFVITMDRRDFDDDDEYEEAINEYQMNFKIEQLEVGRIYNDHVPAF